MTLDREPTSTSLRGARAPYWHLIPIAFLIGLALAIIFAA